MSDSQKMNEITDQGIEVPEKWIWTKLGDVCKTKSGGTPSRNNKSYYGGTIPWLKSGELKNEIIKSAEESVTESGLENSSTKIIPKGTLLIALYGATVGKLGILGIDAAINQAICAIYINDNLDKKFLFWYLSSYRNELLNSRIGGAQPNVSQQIINDVPIPLPPLLEQRLIVERLDYLLEHLNTAKESLDKIPLIMKRFRQAALKKAFSGELTAEWREQRQDLEPAAELLKRIQEEWKHHYEEEVRRAKAEGRKLPKKLILTDAEPLDISDLPELPERWMWCKIREIVEIRYGKGLTEENRRDGKFPVYGSNGIVGFHDQPLTKGTTIVIGRKGSVGEVNYSQTACWPIDTTYFIDDFVLVNSSYIFHLLKNLRLGELDKSTAIPGVNRDDIYSISIPLSPLPEQQEIVRRIESLFKFADETEKNATEARKHLEIMTQSILARAFRGDLSVDFREAVRNWKDLDAEARRRYVFVLPEEERKRVLKGDEFPMEAASRLLESIREERTRNKREKKITKTGRQNNQLRTYGMKLR